MDLYSISEKGLCCQALITGRRDGLKGSAANNPTPRRAVPWLTAGRRHLFSGSIAQCKVGRSR
jgi:hypothetical protein